MMSFTSSSSFFSCSGVSAVLGFVGGFFGRAAAISLSNSDLFAFCRNPMVYQHFCSEPDLKGNTLT